MQALLQHPIAGGGTIRRFVLAVGRDAAQRDAAVICHAGRVTLRMRRVDALDQVLHGEMELRERLRGVWLRCDPRGVRIAQQAAQRVELLPQIFESVGR